MRKIFFLLLFPIYLVAGKNIPRHVLAFWDSRVDKESEDTIVHRMLEMPLNFLGIDVIYHDIHDPLPDISKRDDLLGFIVCFQEATRMKNPTAFIDWAVEMIDSGKKILLFRSGGFHADLDGTFTHGSAQTKLYERLGIINTQKYIEYPFDYEFIISKNEFYPFEREYPTPLPPFYVTKVYDPSAISLLKVGIPGKVESDADLFVISPNGLYVANGFASSLQVNPDPKTQQWYINPFTLFEKFFDLQDRPIPDPTTLAGKRVFFSTQHGDNWNAKTDIEEYRKQGLYCSEILLEKVIKPYPEIPVAVGIVAADVDPDWVEKKRSREIVKKHFNLPQVEAASHSYSHPFEWSFFEGEGAKDEVLFLHNYPYGAWQNSFVSWTRAQYYTSSKEKEKETVGEEKEDEEKFAETLSWGYVTPRAYANEPFNLEKEIYGSVSYLNKLAPTWNPVKLMIWAGNGRPWGEPVAMCYEKNIKQIGGGSVRFDPEYPSCLFVYPLGRKPGGHVQLYNSSNAENDYTEEWSTRFYGFKYLPETLKNTETPRRLKPILLYYHTYAGTFSSSVDALVQDIEHIKKQNIIPIQVARYCDVGAGFYSIEIEPLKPFQWKFKNRNGLQTIRFDHPTKEFVDFTKSEGVIGYLPYQNSLYVYLDAAIKDPILTLTSEKLTKVPYLIDSNWEVWDLKRSAHNLEFKTKGWGALSMKWKFPKEGAFVVSVSSLDEDIPFTSDESLLKVELELPFNKEIIIKIAEKMP